MSECTLCGSKSSAPFPSPFGRILCLGYYDGPTNGIVLCKTQSRAYRFELIAWDSHCDNRIYALVETRPDIFDSIVEVLSALEQPRWPFWMPRAQVNSSGELRSEFDQANRILSTIVPPNVVVAADSIDGEILRCRKIDAKVRAQLPQISQLSEPDNWRF